MTAETIGILHPGQMGISIAAATRRAGHRACYASEGRSAATRSRARQHDLEDAGTLARLCRMCGVMISICPPHAAEGLADQVLQHGFRGLYLNANAVAPQRALGMAAKMEGRGVEFVDGAVIGGPAWVAGETRLYLSGRAADRIAACFAAGPFEVRVIGDSAGRASALKMCYAAYSKGTTALLAAILALAEASGVRDELYAQWQLDGLLQPAETEARVRRVTAKAWRFTGEMDEIATTFEAAGLPGGFHAAASEVYRRLRGFKDSATAPELNAVIAALLKP
jgi:3-hydroxyisobutyrate dehydrogenase-like beta-hydroxyacid dehydrogenase